ncbi:MAG: ThuA domain-containing protein [Armatimonadota bacterium]
MIRPRHILAATVAAALTLSVSQAALAAHLLHRIPGAPAAPKLRVLILTGKNNHNWRATTPALREMLEDTGRFVVHVTYRPERCTAEKLAHYDVLMSNYNARQRWGEPADSALLDYVRGGGGLVIIHAANNAFPGWDEYDQLIGGAWRKGAGHGVRWSFPVEIVDRDHPVTRGMPDFQNAEDELYHRLTMQPHIRLLAHAFSRKDKRGTGNYEPQLWTVRYGEGRVFHNSLGHDTKAMSGGGFINVTQRGTEWAATGRVTIPIPPDFPKAKPEQAEE